MIKLIKIGALTSKSYAFVARNWELKTYEFIDFFDNVGSNIRIDTRGSTILRVLPSINEKINEEWISDKIRYCFDGLKQQRLYFPLIIKNTKLLTVSWFYLFIYIYYIFSINFLNEFFKKFKFFIGNFKDLETCYSIKFFFERHNISNIITTNYKKELTDFKFIFNSKLINLQKIDLGIFFNINLRLEAPMLNLKIRKNFLLNDSLFYNIGNHVNFSFFIKTISTNMNILTNIFTGIHWICQKIKKSRYPFFLMQDFSKYIYLNYLIKIFILFSDLYYQNWYGLNLLNNNNTDLNFKLLNIKFNKNQIINFIWLKKQKNYIYNIGSDNKLNLIKDSFLIYQGHHGDLNTQYAKIIIPTTFLIEQTSSFINLEGRFQKRNRIFFPNKNLRTDIQILKAYNYYFKNINKKEFSNNNNYKFFLGIDYTFLLLIKLTFLNYRLFYNLNIKSFDLNILQKDIIFKNSKNLNYYLKKFIFNNFI